MTGDQLPTTPVGRLIELGKIAGAIAAILGLLTGLWAVTVGPVAKLYRSEVAWRAEVMASFEAISERLDAYGATISMLSEPDQVFVVARASGPVEGYCVEREPCDIVVFAKRTPQGRRCEVIPERSRYAFYSNDMMQRREVERLDERPVRNIDGEWTEVVMTLATPSSFAGAANYVFVRSYNNCTGPDDEVVVTQESDPPIPVVICPARGAAPTPCPAPTSPPPGLDFPPAGETP